MAMGHIMPHKKMLVVKKIKLLILEILSRLKNTMFKKTLRIDKKILLKCLLILFIITSPVFLLFNNGCAIPIKFDSVNRDKWIHDLWLDSYIDQGYRVVCYRKRISQNKWVLDGDFYIYNVDGKIIVQGSYQEGLWQGLMICYHNNGIIAGNEFFDHGKLTKKAIYWNENGNKIREVSYNNGKKNGAEIYWNDDGSIEIIYYWSDSIISKIDFYKDKTIKKSLFGKDANNYILNLYSNQKR